MHFGRGDLATEKAHEAALISCLRHFESQIDHLFLLGDVFDQYIEYANLVPKGVARFQGLLAEWTDKGMPVTYLVGNHDPWHIDYFKNELGVNVLPASFSEPLNGKHVYLNHGDIVASRFPLGRLLKRALQHPIPVFLYRSLLPADAGFRLARRVNRYIHSDVINETVVLKLREHAASLLSENRHDPCDLVVMGHSHHAELTPLGDGVYLNTGCWRLHRSFAAMIGDEVRLFRWNDSTTTATTLSKISFASKSETLP